MESWDDTSRDFELESIEKSCSDYDSILISARRVLRSSQPANSSNNSNNSGPSCNSKLPKLQLPTFSGDVLLFNDFLQSFTTSVDNSNISNVQKFNYLKSLLRGEALNLISGLELCDANYFESLNLLKGRYGSQKRQRRAHIRKLLSFDCSNAKDVLTYRAFLDNINKHIRGLNNLGLKSDQYGDFLSEILIDKVPNRIKLEWAQLSDDKMNLDSLLNIIEVESKKLELIKNTTNSNINRMKDKFNKDKSPTRNYSNDISNTKFKCCICKTNSHSIYKCETLISASPEKRLELVQSNKLCKICLGSHNNPCLSKYMCKLCNQKHSVLLHNSLVPRSNDNTISSGCNAICNTDCILPIISIPIICGGKMKYWGALLDSGSQRSFIKPEAVSSIDHVVGDTVPLQINGFGGYSEETCQNIEITIPWKDTSLPINLIASNSFMDITVNDVSRFHPLLKSNGLTPCHSPKSVNIIIGSDNFYTFVTGNTIKLTNQAFAIETIFGWVLHGHINNINCNTYINNVNSELNEESPVDVEKFWDNELAGILPIQNEVEINENQVLKNFQSSIIQSSDGRYYVNFPWKDTCTVTSSYFEESNCRLNHTLRRLLKDQLLPEYDAIFKEYLSLGIIEKCSNNATEICRYLPHHPVIKRERESTKVRIVFDGSAKSKNEYSLNDCLHEGPNMFPNIVGVMIRFRLYKYALTGDIEKAFLQVGLQNSDRDLVRFLWFEDKLNNAYPSTRAISYRFTRVPFGAKASPFLLNATIRFHIDSIETKYPQLVPLLRKSLYVDDFITSCASIDHLFAIQHDAIEIFKSMQMKMHKWKSNMHNISSPCITSILGMLWDTSSDTLSVKFPIKSKITNKRELTGLICSLFDPLGFYSPFVIQLKIILQDVWKSKSSWDEALPLSILNQIDSIQNDVMLINNHKIPRHIGLMDYNFDNIHLNVFADASQRAYAACIYMNN